MRDRLRALWDFGDLDASERRFRAQLEREKTTSGRAEVLTQLTRVRGLRGDFVEGERLLSEAEALDDLRPAAEARIRLERGRLRRSSGDVEGARTQFESAFATAAGSDEWFLAADAAHMAALAAPDRDGLVAWTERGVDLAERESGAAYWLGPLLNNLGWANYENGEHEAALDAFLRALEARELDPEQPAEIALARYAVGKVLRALGRADEAAAQLEAAVAWAQEAGAPDGWFHEELAEDYVALGRAAEAREQAELALPLLAAADQSFDPDAARAKRLRRLAAGG